MSHQVTTDASSQNSSQVHPMLRTLRAELCGLEVEAVKLANQKHSRKYK